MKRRKKGQVDMFPPYVRDSDTSRGAADSIKAVTPALRLQVLAQIKACGIRGSTDDELERALKLRHQTASARRRELCLQNAVRDSGERRKTRSGRSAVVWVAE